MAIQQTLKKLGLTDKEIKIYITLLKNGKTKPSTLAILTKINRPTLYNLAKNLVSKGMIAEDMSEKTMHFTPLPPESLEAILEPAKREIKEKENTIKKAIGELSLITSEKTYPIPKIRFIQEDNLNKFLFANTIKWQKEVINSDGIWWAFQENTFVEKFEKWIKSTWETKESKDKNYSAQLFTNQSQIERKLEIKYPKEKRHVRFLEDINFTATTWVCGNYLIVMQTIQRPFYLFEIHDKLLANNMRETFKKLWETTAL